MLEAGRQTWIIHAAGACLNCMMVAVAIRRYACDLLRLQNCSIGFLIWLRPRAKQIYIYIYMYIYICIYIYEVYEQNEGLFIKDTVHEYAYSANIHARDLMQIVVQVRNKSPMSTSK